MKTISETESNRKDKMDAARNDRYWLGVEVRYHGRCLVRAMLSLALSCMGGR